MKPIHFYKYQGTGNDFIMIDNRSNFFPKNDAKLISFLCNRHFGIGSDGLILIENAENYDFRMVFFNPDASQSMCGNGGRCSVAFAHKLGIIEKNTTFVAIDGEHQAQVLENEKISIKMLDVSKIETSRNFTRLNTGSPHQVEICKNLENFDVKSEGAKIRFKHSTEGINVNFVEPVKDNIFKVRTYERGVEDETFSCGTGATAVAIAMHKTKKTEQNEIILQTKGGELSVSFEVNNKLLGLKKEYQNVYLTGGAKLIFEGEILCNF